MCACHATGCFADPRLSAGNSPKSRSVANQNTTKTSAVRLAKRVAQAQRRQAEGLVRAPRRSKIWRGSSLGRNTKRTAAPIAPGDGGRRRR